MSDESAAEANLGAEANLAADADAQAEFAAEAADLERGLPRLGPFTVSGVVRRVRRLADLSQRRLAAQAGVAVSTSAR